MYRRLHRRLSRSASGKKLLCADIGDVHDPRRDGSIRCDRRALAPHVKHRIANQFFDEIDVPRHVHEGIREPRKVQEIDFSHSGAITGGNVREELARRGARTVNFESHWFIPGFGIFFTFDSHVDRACIAPDEPRSVRRSRPSGGLGALNSYCGRPIRRRRSSNGTLERSGSNAGRSKIEGLKRAS